MGLVRSLRLQQLSENQSLTVKVDESDDKISSN